MGADDPGLFGKKGAYAQAYSLFSVAFSADVSRVLFLPGFPGTRLAGRPWAGTSQFCRRSVFLLLLYGRDRLAGLLHVLAAGIEMDSHKEIVWAVCACQWPF